MGLSVFVWKPAGRDWFTSTEHVRGTITLDKQNLVHVSRVIVYLEGMEDEHYANFRGV